MLTLGVGPQSETFSTTINNSTMDDRNDRSRSPADPTLNWNVNLEIISFAAIIIKRTIIMPTHILTHTHLQAGRHKYMYLYSTNMPTHTRTQTHTLSRSYAFVLRALIVVVAFLLRNAIRFSHCLRRDRRCFPRVCVCVCRVSLCLCHRYRVATTITGITSIAVPRHMRLWHTLQQNNDLILR